MLLVLALAACSSATTQSTPTLTPAPTQTAQSTQAPASPTAAPKWITTHTFTGNGEMGGSPDKKTPIFTVGDDWKIIWKCDPNSFGGAPINVAVTVDAPDGTWQPAINATCNASHTSGETEEHKGGQVYLDVTSEGAWTVQVQELK